MTHRLIVLTDIKRGLENDDIPSMARLLLYANDIDLEALIAVTSSWHRRGTRPKDARLIHRLIDAYGEVKANLDRHADGYPEVVHLHRIVNCGIRAYGRGPGDGFADEEHHDNAGVTAILRAVDREDPRPVWVALWGGANTLVQAIWTAERTKTVTEFNAFLRRMRVHAISDQDAAGQWIRDRYGARLFYIVSPSEPEGGQHYRHATWPGISADRFVHGSEDGHAGGGFRGAGTGMVSRRWLQRNIRRGRYGREYPLHRFIMEGDTPSYLSLIPNGLDDPEHPNLGGWGGRYERGIPDVAISPRVEPHPIWTSVADDVIGLDGQLHRSPQASIWRWREAFQNDFAARISWTLTDRYEEANHPPIVGLAHGPVLRARTG